MQIFSASRPDINMTLKSRRFRVEPLPRFAPDLRWRTEAMRSYVQPMLYWFTRGQGRITIAGVTHSFGPHHAVFLPAGTMHGYEMMGQVFGTILSFPQDTTLTLPDAPCHFRFRDVGQQNELTNLIENLSRELENDLPGQDRALQAHAGLLSVWLDREGRGDNQRALNGDAATRLSAAFSSLVEQDYRTGQPISAYAAKLGVTPTHLTRSCNAASGRSASALLADRVHFEARRLLVETKHPIKDIARQLGFRSAAYFTRSFQKHTGKTPTDFRQNR